MRINAQSGKHAKKHAKKHAQNTPRGDRTHDLRIWNPLLYQLSYRRLGEKKPRLFPLDFVQSVPTKTRTELLEAKLHLLQNSAFDADFCSIVQVTRFGALQPHIFTVETFLCH